MDELEIKTDDAIVLVHSICREARKRFELCGSADDYCVQDVGWDVIVFGGLNRVLWSVYRGLRPDPSYCTPRFLEEWRLKYGD